MNTARSLLERFVELNESSVSREARRLEDDVNEWLENNTEDVTWVGLSPGENESPVATCDRCGVSDTFNVPIPISALNAWIQAVELKHRDCKPK